MYYNIHLNIDHIFVGMPKLRGTSIRLERIFNRHTGNAVIIPMDHGVTVGPIKGIKSVKTIADAVARGGADAAVVHKGAAIFGHRGYGRDLGLIIHLPPPPHLARTPITKSWWRQ